MHEDAGSAFRTEVLRACGARPAVVGELLAYTANHFETDRVTTLALPLPDEAHVSAWEAYGRDAEQDGVFAALKRRFVQLHFPVQEDISQTQAYRAATRRGVFPVGAGAGLSLNQPGGLELSLHRTFAGRIPVLAVDDREDFVALVRAFACRNEPEPVPVSMGACIVAGLNNWDRVARHRRSFEAARGVAGDEAAWAEEFRELTRRKELYQDRFLIISRGPYSGVPAAAVGLGEEEWLARSLVVRRAHECTHYVCKRILGRMSNNAHDEIIADFAGLLAGFGRYDGDLALRFFGLESFPAYRRGGRLELYLGQPPLSPAAVEVLRVLVFRAVRNIEALAAPETSEIEELSGRMVLALACLTLEELASTEMAQRLQAALRGQSNADPDEASGGDRPLSSGL